MIPRYGLLFSIVATGLACNRPPGPTVAAPPPAPPTAGPAAAPQDLPLVVFLGTSLTAGYGLADPSLAYPALIQAMLDSAGMHYRVVNAGLSGETSAGALRRIDWVMSQGKVALLMVETGANDGLRGQDPDSLRSHLEAIIARANQQRPRPKVIIAGMEVLPNLGETYASRFRSVFPTVARSSGAALVPFLLANVAGVDSLNQADGIHPTPLGQRIVAATVWRVVRRELDGPANRP